MTLHPWIAVLAALVLGLVMGFQLLLVAGLPLGHAAWRGRYRVLPRHLRWASLATVGMLGLAAWVVLARVGLVAPGAEPVAVRVATWVFAGCLALTTVGNLASQSKVERSIMTPIALLLV